MKRNFLYLCLIAGALSMGSCDESDDIDKLQDQFDELVDKVDQMEKAQQEALLDQIAELKAMIEELKSSNSEMSDNYNKMLEDLAKMNDLIEEANSDDVFYGNVLTDADFSKLVDSEAIIVTGKISVSSQEQVDAISNVKLIGGYLELTGGTDLSFPMLENIGGDLIVSNINEAEAIISFPMLSTVGGAIHMNSNSMLKSFTTEKLVMIYNDLLVENNPVLMSIDMPMLDLAGGVSVNGAISDNGFLMRGNLNLDLSGVDVKGDVNISYLAVASELILGKVDGNFVCKYNGIRKLELGADVINGDFIFEGNGLVEELLLDNLTRIEGKLDIIYNVEASSGIGGSADGIKSIAAFNGLEYIGGDVVVSGNGGLTELEVFNNVTAVKGSKIEFQNNGQNKSLVSVFSALTSAGEYEWSYVDIKVVESTEWFIGFTSIGQVNNVEIDLNKPVEVIDGNWVQGNVCKFEGFDNVESVNKLVLNISQVTDFKGFGSLMTFMSYEEYFRLIMPEDSNVGICSMESVLMKIKNGDFDSEWNADKKAVFMDFNWMEVDRNTAIETLLAPCD